MSKDYSLNPYIVLGMHRSATSTIARGLRKAGVYMGDKLLPANTWNPKGYYENIDFVKMNDKILKLAGGKWYDPPPRHRIINTTNLVAEEIQELIRKYSVGLWGWKDPRTSLTIDCYMPFLNKPIFITCLRNPGDVARSLNKIHNFPIEFGVNLAKEYNRRILEFMSEQAQLNE